MKTKYILLILLCLSISGMAETWVSNNLKNRADDAATRTLVRNTEKVVSKKSEETIDAVTLKEAGKGNKNKEIKKGTYNTPANKQTADLELQVNVQPFSTQLGGAVTFTIAINNKGPATSGNIVSKVHIPSSYSVSNITTTQGNYNRQTKLWEVESLQADGWVVMTIEAVVMDDADLMTTGEIMSCSTQDPDSTPGNGIDTNGNGNIVDDPGDEDDGDGQNVIIGEINSSQNNNDNNNNNSNNTSATDNSMIITNILRFDTDVKMEMVSKKDKMISYLDFNTMAMRMEDHSRRKKNPPMYWDKDGYIYSGDGKGNYYKIPFDEIKSFGKNLVTMFTMGSQDVVLPKVQGKEVDLDWPSEPVIYNGHELHIYPNKYPMIEWVFVFHPNIFVGADNVTEASSQCSDGRSCAKFTFTQGENRGAAVLFDSENRLAEITNPDGSYAIYTYEDCTVTLPSNAQSFNFDFK